MLTAAEEGKTVQMRPHGNQAHGFSAVCNLEQLAIRDFDPSRYEWRVKPEPREVWINDSQFPQPNVDGCGGWGQFRPLEAAVKAGCGWRKFREVID